MGTLHSLPEVPHTLFLVVCLFSHGSSDAALLYT